MLASITPLGERGRDGHWSLTVIAFTAGAGLAGALAGAFAGLGGELVLPASFGAAARLGALAVAALAAIGLDLRAATVPGPRRQVDERWLHEFRGWVYGLGYGTQLGLGIVTVISSAATYLALLAAVLVGDAGQGAIVMGCYGLIRGLSLLVASRVRTPDQLLSLHAWLELARAGAQRGGIVLLGAIFAGAVAGATL
jgi:hypothetical protein